MSLRRPRLYLLNRRSSRHLVNVGNLVKELGLAFPSAADVSVAEFEDVPFRDQVRLLFSVDRVVGPGEGEAILVVRDTSSGPTRILASSS